MMTGGNEYRSLRAHRLENLVAAGIGQIEIEHDTVEALRRQLRQRLARRADVMNRHALEREQLAHAGAQLRVVFDDENASHPLIQPLLETGRWP